MAVLDDALNLFLANPASGAIIMLAGFLLCHLLHAFRYGFFGGFGKLFDKIKKFIKILFFLNV